MNQADSQPQSRIPDRFPQGQIHRGLRLERPDKYGIQEQHGKRDGQAGYAVHPAVRYHNHKARNAIQQCRQEETGQQQPQLLPKRHLFD